MEFEKTGNTTAWKLHVRTGRQGWNSAQHFPLCIRGNWRQMIVKLDVTILNNHSIRGLLKTGPTKGRHRRVCWPIECHFIITYIRNTRFHLYTLHFNSKAALSEFLILTVIFPARSFNLFYVHLLSLSWITTPNFTRDATQINCH